MKYEIIKVSKKQEDSLSKDMLKVLAKHVFNKSKNAILNKVNTIKNSDLYYQAVDCTSSATRYVSKKAEELSNNIDIYKAELKK